MVCEWLHEDLRVVVRVVSLFLRVVFASGFSCSTRAIPRSMTGFTVGLPGVVLSGKPGLPERNKTRGKKRLTVVTM